MSNVVVPNERMAVNNLINGSWTKVAGRLIEVETPYVAKTIGEVSEASEEQVSECISAAYRAFSDWSHRPLKERTQYLFNLRNLMLENIDELGHRAALESGKTVAEAKAGVMKGLEVAEFALSQQNFDLGGAMEVSRGVSCRYKREPLGVVCGITPFNFPCMVPMWMIPIAVTAGNCFILKPSEKVPLTAQLMGELMVKAGYPDGVFSILNGGKQVVDQLITHEHVKAVAFVGSTSVAKSIYQKATSELKRCAALGGAKNLLIVVPDANEDLTVKGIVDSFTGCAGQRCMAASLMVGVGDVSHIVDKVVRKASEIQLGEDMGAIIDKASYERIIGIIERAEKSGAKILLDGRNPKAPEGYEGGYWLGPTVIEAKAEDECAQVEIFGPVVTIVRSESLSAAIKFENAQPYGNATSIFTSSAKAAEFVGEHASNGMIGVNIGVPVPREPFSFGGTKASKFGAHDITGHDAVDFWTVKKKITTKWAPQEDQNWMS